MKINMMFAIIAMAIITASMYADPLRLAFAGAFSGNKSGIGSKIKNLFSLNFFKEGEGEPGAPTLKKNEKGQIIFDNEQELTAAMDDVADRAVAKHIKVHNLDKPAPLPGAPSPEDAKKNFDEVPGETRAQRNKRLNGALIQIKLGKMKIEDAPKEIQLNRLLKAIYVNDYETVRALTASQKALTEGTAADGGNLVPTQFGSDLLVAIEDYGTCERDCSLYPMTTSELDLRTVTAKPVVAVNGELIVSTESATKFGKPRLIADRISGHQIISLEELEDNNVQLYQRLIDLFGEAMGKINDQRGLVTNILTDWANTKKTTLESVHISDITYKKLVALNRSLTRGQLAGGGKYYMHETIFGLIEGMEDQQGRPITTQPFADRGPTLFGRPVEFNEVLPTVDGDAADTAFIIFGNLKWLAMGRRSDMTFDLLKEATVPKDGGGTVNLPIQGARALYVYMRNGFVLTIPSNIATLGTKA